MTQQLVGMLQPVQSEFIRDPFAVVVGVVDLFRFLACIDSEQQTIRRRQNIGELLHKCSGFGACEVANAGAQRQHYFGPTGIFFVLQPFEAVVVSSMQSKALDVFESPFRHGSQSAFQLRTHEIQSVVRHILPSSLQSVQENLYLAKVACSG